MCVTCHGAPGKERGDIGKGLNPRPPHLSEASKFWSAGELFWIVKHGVRMSFGPTHSDDRIWSIVSFLTQLAKMTPEQYEQMEQTLAPDHHERSHKH
jgi:mono/diheme cytochrome c family protein